MELAYPKLFSHEQSSTKFTPIYNFDFPSSRRPKNTYGDLKNNFGYFMQ